MENYDYRPLAEADRHQIRLLKIDRSLTMTSNLQCHLETFDFDQAPRYTALSYQWTYAKPGEEEHKCPLIIDGKRSRISQNLADFFEAFRSDPKNKPVWLWIDQVCINQRDKLERNQQVGMMTDIYSQCQSLIIWLGKASALAAEQGWPDGRVSLLQNSYFNRMWIVQEILLAERKEVLAGTVWIDWEDMRFIPEGGPLEGKGVPRATIGLLEQAYTYTRGSTNLQALLASCYGRQCTDPHDFVYGLLGLVSEDQRPEINYEKTLWEVFLDTALAVCNAPYDKDSSAFWCGQSLLGLAASFTYAERPRRWIHELNLDPFFLNTLVEEMRYVAMSHDSNQIRQEIHYDFYYRLSRPRLTPGPKKIVAIGIDGGRWWFEYLDTEGKRTRERSSQTVVSAELAGKLGWFNKYSR